MPDPVSVVFIHGFMGRGSDWDAIRLQLPNHMATHVHEVAGDSMDEVSRHILTTGPDRTVLAGYSMGARLALHTAVRHPGKVRALILESGMPGLEAEEERVSRTVRDEAKASELRRGGMLPFLQAWYKQTLFDSLQEKPALRGQLIEDRLDLNPERVADELCQLSVAGQPDHWAALPNLSMPVLALAGALDHKYAAVAERIAGLCTKGQCRVIDQAGHNVHLEKPEAYVAAVNKFLTELGDD